MKRLRLHRHTGFAPTASSCAAVVFPMNHQRLEGPAGLVAVRNTVGIIPLGVGTKRIPGSSGEHLLLMSGRARSFLIFFFPFTFPFSQATVSCILVRMDPLSRCSTAIKSFPLAVEKKVIRLNTLASDRVILKVCFQPYLVNRPAVL